MPTRLPDPINARSRLKVATQAHLDYRLIFQDRQKVF
jgi:hypothetical protein